MCETWLVWWGNGSCSIIISCCWTRTDILIFFVHYERRMSECAWQFLFLVTQSKSHDNTSNNAIYKTKLEFKSPSVSAHCDILIYYKRNFILGYNFFEHLKNSHREYVQKCQNYKNCWELRCSTIKYNKTKFHDLVKLYEVLLKYRGV